MASYGVFVLFVFIVSVQAEKKTVKKGEIIMNKKASSHLAKDEVIILNTIKRITSS